MLCSECGAKIPDGLTQCKLCGAPAPKPVPVVTSGRFCSRCGKSLLPGDAFCGSCGTSASSRPGAPEPPRKPVKKFNPLPLLIALVASVGIILGIISFSSSDFTAYGRGYETTVERYGEYYCEGQWDKFLTLFHDDVLEETLDTTGLSQYEAEQSLDSQGASFLLQMNERLGYGWDYSCVITGEQDLTGSTLEDAQEGLEDACGVRVSAIKMVEVNLIAQGSFGSQTIVKTLCLVKIGWSWYLLAELGSWTMN